MLGVVCLEFQVVLEARVRVDRGSGERGRRQRGLAVLGRVLLEVTFQDVGKWRGERLRQSRRAPVVVVLVCLLEQRAMVFLGSGVRQRSVGP